MYNNNKFDKQKGIALISMMFTNLFIIMLIGALITIYSGENGILVSNSNSQGSNEQALVEEKIKLAVTEILADNVTQNKELKITLNQLNEKLETFELGPAEEDGKGGFILNVGSDVYSISSEGSVTLVQDD